MVRANTPKLVIDEMFAFVAEEGPGEGIMACSLPIPTGDGTVREMMTPMVGADMERVAQLLPIAEEIAGVAGKNFRIVRFTNREDITDKVMQLRKAVG